MREEPQQIAGRDAMRRAALYFRMHRRRWSGRAPQASSRRRRKTVAVARLGGDGRRGRFLGTSSTLRRLRLRWMAAMYRRALRRLRACYAKAVQDALEGAALFGAVRAEAGV